MGSGWADSPDLGRSRSRVFQLRDGVAVTQAPQKRLWACTSPFAWAVGWWGALPTQARGRESAGPTPREGHPPAVHRALRCHLSFRYSSARCVLSTR